MFSKELENLIQATLEDGILEEYEKAALVKRATAEGVDITELEIYINSLLQKRKRELDQERNAENILAEQRKKEAYGRVCPACGKQITPMTLKCVCGYEITTQQKRVPSIQILSDKLNNITFTKAEEEEISEIDRNHQEEKRAELYLQKRIEIITTFPIPNTKEDIIEFLSISIPLANQKLGPFEVKRNWECAGLWLIFIVFVCFAIESSIVGIWEACWYSWLPIFLIFLFYSGTFCSRIFTKEGLRNAWHAKCEQILIQSRSLRGDAEFTQQMNNYERLLNKKHTAEVEAEIGIGDNSGISIQRSENFQGFYKNPWKWIGLEIAVTIFVFIFFMRQIVVEYEWWPELFYGPCFNWIMGMIIVVGACVAVIIVSIKKFTK